MMSCCVSVAGHRIEGEEEFCRQVFLLAVSVAKRGGPFAVSADRMVFLSPASEISIDVPEGFTKEVDYTGAYQALLRPARRGVIL